MGDGIAVIYITLMILINIGLIVYLIDPYSDLNKNKIKYCVSFFCIELIIIAIEMMLYLWGYEKLSTTLSILSLLVLGLVTLIVINLKKDCTDEH